ncbi:conserved hypothetical protein [methanotrophic bacterial endosymbiont of Bathymodiolus sp.]|nr:conserved hypothetical protein [methanotrophic bacterial endosymbiont of Bathymodiolus sp.]
MSYQKHPHGRGEDQKIYTIEQIKRETPPRAWGRPDIDENIIALTRNTPTGVGKTVTHDVFHCPMSKHPHGRGEDPLGA